MSEGLDVSVDPLEMSEIFLGSVAIAPGVMLPATFVARTYIQSPQGTGHHLAVEVHIVTPPHSPPMAKRVVLSRSGNGVTGVEMRRVPIARIVSEAAKQVVWIASPQGRPVMGQYLMPVPDEIRDAWPDGENLTTLFRYVAATYLVADALGEGPTAAVASTVGVSRATAGRMVDAARKAGMLRPHVEPGKTRALSREDVAKSLGLDVGDDYDENPVWQVGPPANIEALERTYWPDHPAGDSAVDTESLQRSEEGEDH